MEVEQNVPAQNMPLWYKNYLEADYFLRNSRFRSSSENRAEVTVLLETFTFMKPPFVKGIFPLYQETESD